MAVRKKAVPSAAQNDKEMPDTGMTAKEIPDGKIKEKEKPMVGKPENTVMIGGKPVEIKPTKVRYQRNGTAAFYHMLDIYPLVDILASQAGQFGDDRDGDKSVMDWLIAVTDDEELITTYYDDMDTQVIERLLAIYKRINRITEKEQKLKNLERAAMTKE